MKSIILIIIFCTVIINTIFSQRQDTVYKTYTNIKDLLTQTRQSNVRLFLYCDSSSGYKISIPDWLDLKETYNDKILGGTFPSVNGIENAFAIASFDKGAFKSFEDFKKIYLTGNTFGSKTRFSNEHIWYGQNDMQIIKNGVAQKVFLIWHNKVYHDKFVLIETPKAYLWIQFSATPDTYGVNISKFNDLIKGLEIIE